jgi:hypothetical protein
MAVSHLLPAVPLGACEMRGSAPLRLTRRGRAVVRVAVVVVFALVVVGAVLGLSRTASAGTRVSPMSVNYRVVLPGESLLGIAAEVDPRADVRDTAVRIARLNGLRGWGLQAGQRLALPAGE